MTEDQYEKEEYLEQDEEEIAGSGRRKGLVALLLVGALVAATLFIVDRLRSVSELQDCMMTRANNCNDMVEPPKPIGARP
jgi:hypothetical protein